MASSSQPSSEAQPDPHDPQSDPHDPNTGLSIMPATQPDPDDSGMASPNYTTTITGPAATTDLNAAVPTTQVPNTQLVGGAPQTQTTGIPTGTLVFGNTHSQHHQLPDGAFGAPISISAGNQVLRWTEVGVAVRD